MGSFDVHSAALSILDMATDGKSLNSGLVMPGGAALAAVPVLPYLLTNGVQNSMANWATVQEVVDCPKNRASPGTQEFLNGLLKCTTDVSIVHYKKFFNERLEAIRKATGDERKAAWASLVHCRTSKTLAATPNFYSLPEMQATRVPKFFWTVVDDWMETGFDEVLLKALSTEPAERDPGSAVVQRGNAEGLGHVGGVHLPRLCGFPSPSSNWCGLCCFHLARGDLVRLLLWNLCHLLLLLPNSCLEVGQRLGRHLGRGLSSCRILLDGGHLPFLRVLASHGPLRPGDDMPSTHCRTCRGGLSGEGKEGEGWNHLSLAAAHAQYLFNPLAAVALIPPDLKLEPFPLGGRLYIWAALATSLGLAATSASLCAAISGFSV